MKLNRVGVAWARSAHASARDQFSVGALVVGNQTAADGVIGLIETLAYVGDVLSFEQDQVAAEGFVATAYDDERDLLDPRRDAHLRALQGSRRRGRDAAHESRAGLR